LRQFTIIFLIKTRYTLNRFALLATELAPDQDAHLVATSVIGLAKYYVEYQPLLKNFPGWKPEHEMPEVAAAHITELLLKGLKAKAT
jgi:hypothetical protein